MKLRQQKQEMASKIEQLQSQLLGPSFDRTRCASTADVAGVEPGSAADDELPASATETRRTMVGSGRQKILAESQIKPLRREAPAAESVSSEPFLSWRVCKVGLHVGRTPTDVSVVDRWTG
eukprot:SAG31_NODE_20051_length_585_cov_0.775720_1_plen_121_part_00